MHRENENTPTKFNKPKDGEKGFSILELLVSISIVGILSGLSALQYSHIKSQSFDARAQSDLRNAMSAQEAYYSANEEYVDEIAELTGFDTGSPAVTVILEQDGLSWSASSYHPRGTSTYCFNSSSSEILVLKGVDRVCPT